MRDLVLAFGVAGALGLTLAYPYVGVLLWSWFALEQPHQETYGFAQTAPMNFILAIVALGAWLLSRERKTVPAGPIFWALAILLLWMSFNSFFGFDPAYSWKFWNLTWKTFLLGFVIAATANSRVRIYALIWIIVISLFFYGIKGGLFTILTGGQFVVLGPESTVIGDNNQIAVALLMVLPLANYLRGQVADKRISFFLLAAVGLTILAIVGTYSRGALVGLGALAVFMLLRVRNRVVYLAMAGVVVLFIVNFMPEQFFDRAATLSASAGSLQGPSNAWEDESFQARIDAWRVAYEYASDHFPFGAGFYALQLARLYSVYSPGHAPHAAHSIYFQVLGEQGFFGLAIYLTILVLALFKCSRIMSATRKFPERRWAYDLALAIQASLFVFCVAGAGLSMAYYDLFIIEVAMLLPLGEIALGATQKSSGQTLLQSAALHKRAGC